MQARRNHQRTGDDEAVYQQDHATLRRLQHCTDYHRNFKTAKGGKDIQGCILRDHGSVMRDGILYDFLLVQYAFMREAGTGPHAFSRRQFRHRVHDGGRRSGIAYAHFTEAQHIALDRGDQVHTGLHRLRTLVGAHRRFLREVARAVGDLAIQQSITLTEIMVHAGIDDMQGTVILPCEDIDRGATGQKVFHHLPGHALRIG
ncbi:hypothetical protein D3C81_1575050 [compost metagenome]